MTRRDILTCIHEPFGDAFYFGPERLSSRYKNDEEAREQSGFTHSTFKTIFERVEREGKEVRSNSTSSFSRRCRPNPLQKESLHLDAEMLLLFYLLLYFGFRWLRRSLSVGLHSKRLLSPFGNFQRSFRDHTCTLVA